MRTTIPSTKPPASTPELQKLLRLEVAILHGLKAFRQVGTNFKKIKQSGLYRLRCRTWAQYCKQAWKLSDRHVNRLIQAADHIAQIGPRGLKNIPEYHLRKLHTLCGGDRTRMGKLIDEARERLGNKASAENLLGSIEEILAERGRQRFLDALKTREPAALSNDTRFTQSFWTEFNREHAEKISQASFAQPPSPSDDKQLTPEERADSILAELRCFVAEFSSSNPELAAPFRAGLRAIDRARAPRDPRNHRRNILRIGAG